MVTFAPNFSLKLHSFHRDDSPWSPSLKCLSYILRHKPTSKAYVGPSLGTMSFRPIWQLSLPFLRPKTLLWHLKYVPFPFHHQLTFCFFKDYLHFHHFKPILFNKNFYFFLSMKGRVPELLTRYRWHSARPKMLWWWKYFFNWFLRPIWSYSSARGTSTPNGPKIREISL